MKNLLTSKYLDIDLHDNQKIICLRWKRESLELTIDTYKDLIERLSKFIEQYKPKFILFNAADLVLPFSQTIKEMMLNILMQALVKGGVKYVAFVKPRDVITAIGLKFLIEAGIQKTPEIVRLVFDTEDEALAWLNQKLSESDDADDKAE